MKSPDQIKLAIREGEGLTIEFKERYTSRIDEDIAAFANSRGGTILLGVRDDGTISGEKLTNDLKARITSLARNCNPEARVSLHQAGPVVAIEVQEGPEKPYSCGSGFFRRLDATSQKMSREEIRTMFRQNDPLPFEEKFVKGFSPKDISREKIKAFLKEAGIGPGGVSTTDFLQSLKVAESQKANIAGILFFAKETNRFVPQAQTTLLAFKGVKKFQIYDRQDVRDDLLTQFNQTIIFLKKHLNLRSEIKGVNREDSYEIPLEALREAVVNALMHRDYSVTGTQISVEIYDDRVEIINPGGLPAGLPQAAFGSMSVRRNELISDLFFRLHKVERVGMGIARMKDSLARAGLRKPRFKSNGFFRAVIYRPKTQKGLVAAGSQKTDLKGSQKTDLKGSQKPDRKVSWNATSRMRSGVSDAVETRKNNLKPDLNGSQKSDLKSSQKPLSDSSQKMLALIIAHPYVTIDEMTNALEISEHSVKKHLRALKKKGMIKRIGPDKGGFWKKV